jgi:DNA-binding transcriptional ArsR family regulator
MVKFHEAALDRTFSALADPTRRALLSRLDAGEEISISELARPLPMSLPAVMKHLDVLADAGLIEREKNGRTVSCRINAAPMEDAMKWLIQYRKFWDESLERLARFLEKKMAEKKN